MWFCCSLETSPYSLSHSVVRSVPCWKQGKHQRERRRQQTPVLAFHVILWVSDLQGYLWRPSFLMQDRFENQFSLQCYDWWKEFEIMELISQTINMRISYQRSVKMALMKANPLVKKQPLSILCTHDTKRIGNYCVDLLVYLLRFGPSCLIPIAVPNLAADVAS